MQRVGASTCVQRGRTCQPRRLLPLQVPPLDKTDFCFGSSALGEQVRRGSPGGARRRGRSTRGAPARAGTPPSLTRSNACSLQGAGAEQQALLEEWVALLRERDQVGRGGGVRRHSSTQGKMLAGISSTGGRAAAPLRGYEQRSLRAAPCERRRRPRRQRPRPPPKRPGPTAAGSCRAWRRSWRSWMRSWPLGAGKVGAGGRQAPLPACMQAGRARALASPLLLIQGVPLPGPRCRQGRSQHAQAARQATALRLAGAAGRGAGGAPWAGRQPEAAAAAAAAERRQAQARAPPGQDVGVATQGQVAGRHRAGVCDNVRRLNQRGEGRRQGGAWPPRKN